MPRYRTKRVFVDAVRFTGENWEEIAVFLEYSWAGVTPDPDAHSLIVATPDGRVRASVNDWLLRSAAGLSVVPGDEFPLLYEPAVSSRDSDPAD